MIRKISIGIALGTCVAISQLAIALAASAASLKVSVGSINSGKAIPAKYAFCVPAVQGHTGPGANFNPSISWSKGPAGTKSYAIIVSDPDVPTIRDNMNKEGVTVSASIPRRTFFHFMLVDIPPDVTSIAEGAASNARVPHGKPATQTKIGVPGLNDYTTVLAGNEAMKGKYYGYDGMCPPWNDEIVHHYHFAVYALSVPTLNLTGDFTGIEATAALKDKVLAQGEVVALYAQNPDVIAKLPK
jgi:Raf kinase inhibitor-like YbhB/YbcL family protein